MSVVWAWQGAVTSTTFRVATKVTTGADVRLAVADNPALTGAVFFGPVTPSAQLVASVTATGLDPDTRYHWAVEHATVLDSSFPGQLLTDPTPGTPVSFVVGAAGDAGLTPEFPGIGTVLASDRLSNHPVFDTIAARAVTENWRRFIHLGDRDYYDLGSGSHGIVGGASLANYRRAYDDVLAQTRQHALYRSVGTDLIWDDHDYGPDSSDGTHVGKASAQQAYREVVAHYPLPGTVGAEGPLYHSFELGRVLFMVADVRSDRSPNSDPDNESKTMLGAAQKAWMASTLAGTDAEVLVWVLPSQWTTSTADSWASFQTERVELVTMFTDLGWLDRMCVVGADSHSLYLITENFTRTIEPFLSSHFPHFHFASLDATPSGGPQTDTGPNSPGRGQYGTISVLDFGTHIAVTGTGYIGDDEWRSHTFVVNTPLPVTPVDIGELTPIIAGSHDPTIEARVLTTFQSGDDPAGTVIEILGGDVHYDATAEVFATCSLEVPGIDEATGRSWFPTLPSALLSPYARELFLRRGVDIGSSILWVPLGIFRLETVEQTGTTSEDPIRLTGSDRMATLRSEPVVAPRQYPPTTTFGFLFADLIGDVYPHAAVVFDDGAGFEQIGRDLVVDDSRYEPLKEAADGLGKRFYVDGFGVFRVEDPPPDDVVLLRVGAGRGGILLEAARRISRQGAINGYVVIGEAGGTADPVRGIAVDRGPSSPTRWRLPGEDPGLALQFGNVPKVESIPTVTTQAQAEKAAQELLRRNLGVPYSADFTAIAHPALRPWHPILVVQRDQSREVHVVETLTIPLDKEAPMTGTTRERTHVQIVSQL